MDDANYDWTHKVYIAPDAKHLVVADDDWHGSQEHVVSFFSEGSLLASYSVTDLVSPIRLKTLATLALGYPDCGAIAFDADALTFTARTTQGDTFVFDAMTGTLIHQSSPFPRIIAMTLAAIAMAMILLFLLTRRERHAATMANERGPAASR